MIDKKSIYDHSGKSYTLFFSNPPRNLLNAHEPLGAFKDVHKEWPDLDIVFGLTLRGFGGLGCETGLDYNLAAPWRRQISHPLSFICNFWGQRDVVRPQRWLSRFGDSRNQGFRAFNLVLRNWVCVGWFLIREEIGFGLCFCSCQIILVFLVLEKRVVSLNIYIHINGQCFTRFSINLQ